MPPATNPIAREGGAVFEGKTNAEILEMLKQEAEEIAEDKRLLDDEMQGLEEQELALELEELKKCYDILTKRQESIQRTIELMEDVKLECYTAADKLCELTLKLISFTEKMVPGEEVVGGKTLQGDENQVAMEEFLLQSRMFIEKFAALQ